MYPHTLLCIEGHNWVILNICISSFCYRQWNKGKAEGFSLTVNREENSKNKDNKLFKWNAIYCEIFATAFLRVEQRQSSKLFS